MSSASVVPYVPYLLPSPLSQHRVRTLTPSSTPHLSLRHRSRSIHSISPCAASLHHPTPASADDLGDTTALDKCPAFQRASLAWAVLDPQGTGRLPLSAFSELLDLLDFHFPKEFHKTMFRRLMVKGERQPTLDREAFCRWYASNCDDEDSEDEFGWGGFTSSNRPA